MRGIGELDTCGVCVFVDSISQCTGCQTVCVLVRMLRLLNSEERDWDSAGTACQRKHRMRLYY